MYQTNTVFQIPNTFVLDRNREPRPFSMGVYPRSTRRSWRLWKTKCNGTKIKQNTTRTGRCLINIDEGITGTQAKSAPHLCK